MARIARWGFAALIMALIPGSASAQAFSPDQLSEMPQVKSASQAAQAIQRAYPRSLQENGVGGKVQIRFVVKADGSVDPATVEIVAATVKALGDAAAEAVGKIQFVPGKKDGSAVAAVVVMPITFGSS